MPFDPEDAAKKLMEGRIVDEEVQHGKTEEVYDDDDHYELPVLEGPPKRVPNTTDYNAEYKNEKINMSLRTKKRE